MKFILGCSRLFLIPIFVAIGMNGAPGKSEAMSGTIHSKQEDPQENDTPQQLLERIIEIARENSVYAPNVEWSELAAKARRKLGDSPKIDDLAVPVQELLYELGDYHGAILIRGKRFAAMLDGKEVERHREKGFPLIVENVQKVYERALTEQSSVVAQMLDNNIAYVEVPAINATQDQIDPRATQIRKAIDRLLSQKPDGLIIDLRTNLGGNMHPMFAGLGSVFPNLDMGGQTKNGKKVDLPWSLKNGNVYLGRTATTSLPGAANPPTLNLPVAVLVGRYTSSSGEAVASGLNGQTNVRLFGEHTAGYSTSNDWFTLTPDVMFSPAVGYYISKNGCVHVDGITPQVEIEELLDVSNLTSGKTIDAAKKWLATQLPDLQPAYTIPADAVRPIGSTSSLDKVELDFLNAIPCNVDIVGLGECSHFTRECYTAKHAAIIHLAENEGFNVLLFEVDFGQALKWNDYVVNGTGNLDELISGTGWFTYRTIEFRNFLASVRKHNLTAKRKLHLYGMEMTYTKDCIAWLREYVARNGANADIDKLLKAERTYLAFKQHTAEEVIENWQLYFRIHKFLLDNREALVESSSEAEFETANRITEILRQYATYVSQSEFSLQTELRDMFSTRNVVWAMNQKANSKAIIWAHNGHIRRTNSYDVLGHNLSLMFGDRYYAIGFKFGAGQFGSHDDDWNFKSFQYSQACKPLLEGHLSQFETDLFVDVRSLASQNFGTDHFVNQQVATWRSFGERVEKKHIQSQTRLVLKDTFDGLIFLRRTHSATPFER